MMAVQASDYGIGEFKVLRRLLLFHGRTNLIRISEMILYFFYKNLNFTLINFYFAFYNSFSGQTIIDDWFITLYNMLFTAIPLISNAIFSHDIKPDDGEIVDLLLPFVYKENKENPLFNFSSFTNEIYRALIHGLLNFFIMMQVINYPTHKGHIPDMGSLSIYFISNLMIVKNKYLY
jgi:magnesium-transporting ATPase (P-type)